MGKPEFILDAEYKATRKGEGINAGKIVSRHIEALTVENEKLRRQILRFNYDDYCKSLLPDNANEQEIQALAGKWLVEIHERTDLLKPLESLGIRIFSEDISYQPHFPGVHIEFNSQSLKEENERKGNNARGDANVSGLVRVVGAKPTLREQMDFFLKNGTVDPVTSALVHELVHQSHWQRRQDNEWLESEIQAYFTGIFELGMDFSPDYFIKHLTDEKGVYKFDEDKVRRLVRAVGVLYGLGAGYDEVANLLVASTRAEYLSETGEINAIFEDIPIEKVVADKLESLGLSALDYELEYLYRLHVTNQRLKARIGLFEIISEVAGESKSCLDKRVE